jgi:hypothetical protein
MRRFRPNHRRDRRIAVHQRICGKAAQGGRKRGVFNSVKQRLKGVVEDPALRYHHHHHHHGFIMVFMMMMVFCFG